MDPLLRKVDCVQIPVPDLDAGLRFYRDGLGLELKWRHATQAGLGLPNRDYYLLTGAKYDAYRAAYRNYVITMQRLAGIADPEARAAG